MGVSRGSMFNVRTCLLKNEFVSTDLRKKNYVVRGEAKATYKLQRVIEKLLEMKESADSLPNDEGGTRNESYEFPFARRADLFAQIETELNPTDIPENRISESTMRKAITHLYNNYHMTISIKKHKKFMQCSTCYKLDNLLQATIKGARLDIATQKRAHLNQVNIQRAEYHSLRDEAT
jgi:hypothetical protein